MHSAGFYRHPYSVGGDALLLAAEPLFLLQSISDLVPMIGQTNRGPTHSFEFFRLARTRAPHEQDAQPAAKDDRYYSKADGATIRGGDPVLLRHPEPEVIFWICDTYDVETWRAGRAILFARMSSERPDACPHAKFMAWLDIRAPRSMLGCSTCFGSPKLGRSRWPQLVPSQRPFSYRNHTAVTLEDEQMTSYTAAGRIQLGAGNFGI